MLLNAIHLLLGAAFADSPDGKEFTGEFRRAGCLHLLEYVGFCAVEHKTCTPILRTYNASIAVFQSALI